MHYEQEIGLWFSYGLIFWLIVESNQAYPITFKVKEYVSLSALFTGIYCAKQISNLVKYSKK